VKILATLVVSAAVLLPLLPVDAAASPEELRTAKALFFDRKYTEARLAWRRIMGSPDVDDADAAAYWVARCSEKLGEHARALREYGEYLERGPTDSTLAEEARTSRVGLGTRLYKAGEKQRLPVLLEGLRDPSKSVRYFAALQLASLGPGVGDVAIAVLKRILERETDPDLLDRARLGLLRLDPGALADTGRVEAEERPRAPARQVSWIQLRIFDAEGDEPTVSVSLPVALAELVFRALPDSAREDLRREGYDVDNFWGKLKALGPTEILRIEGDEGGSIQIWLE
jgi:hypothetical protein